MRRLGSLSNGAVRCVQPPRWPRPPGDGRPPWWLATTSTRGPQGWTPPGGP